MEIFKKVFKQTSWQLVGKAISSLSTVFVLSLVSRNFGESGTGVFTLALTYLSFFVLAVDFGINAYLMPSFLKGDYRLTWRKLFGLRLLLSLSMVVLGLLGIAVWPDNETFKALSLLGLVVAVTESAIFSTSGAIFQSKLRYDLSVLSWSAGSITILLLVVLFVKTGLGLNSLILSYDIGWLVISFLSLLFVRKYLSDLRPIFDRDFIRNVFRNAWPISLTLMISTVYFRLDSFILSFYKDLSDVGVYNLSYSVFQSALVVPTFIMNVLYPIMIASFERSRTIFVSQLIRSSLAMSALGVLATLATFFLSPFVIRILTGGKGFLGSVESLQILALSFPAYFLSALLMWTLVTLKRYKAVLVIYFFGFLFNLVTNLVYIPLYSFYAAAWISGASEYLILISQIIILMRSLNKL